jgi:hypothetical protein
LTEHTTAAIAVPALPGGDQAGQRCSRFPRVQAHLAQQLEDEDCLRERFEKKITYEIFVET